MALLYLYLYIYLYIYLYLLISVTFCLNYFLTSVENMLLIDELRKCETKVNLCVCVVEK